MQEIEWNELPSHSFNLKIRIPLFFDHKIQRFIGNDEDLFDYKCVRFIAFLQNNSLKIFPHFKIFVLVFFAPMSILALKCINLSTVCSKVFIHLHFMPIRNH